MIFTQESEYSAVPDACVLVPVALCDFLLRLAEEPAMYRPLWSDEILGEVARALKTKRYRTDEEIAWRLNQMREAFPEATVRVPRELLRAAECIPDEDDRHVLAVAIIARANAVVTQNTKHFPQDCLDKFGVLCQTADDFLIHQYHLYPLLVLEKLEDQAAGIAQARDYVISALKNAAPEFCKLVEAHKG
ncbi:MAG TPA: PIN domain-containing protein [Candidatus Angelobacter sp.]|jgi:predicted nucleic acid-binding protein|nr:PIN domain-containing protein [Candidatus Angelobacter sp.]